MVDWLPLGTFEGTPVREYKATCAIAGTDQVAEIVIAAAGEDMARDVARDAVRLDLDIPIENVTVIQLEDLGPSTL